MLKEVDGPMLEHGIKEMNHLKLWLPKDLKEHPDRDRLAVRFDDFLSFS